MLRAFLDSEAAGGLVLMAAAALALVVANSPLAPAYFAALHAYLGPLSVLHWINDGLMAVFFLLVGLEIKRELLDGQLSTWPRRALPGIAAAGGMAVPALIYAAFNWNDPATLRGWAIPSATDIAFALGVLSLLGPRVPTSLKVFLAALAILDDLGAVAIIAVFYAGDLSFPDLGLAAAVLAALAALNRFGVVRLAPYLLLGAAALVLRAALRRPRHHRRRRARLDDPAPRRARPAGRHGALAPASAGAPPARLGGVRRRAAVRLRQCRRVLRGPLRGRAAGPPHARRRARTARWASWSACSAPRR